MAKITRRTFLASSTALVFPTIVPSHVLGANGAVTPSNQITVGQIGFGWIGGSHLSTLLGRKDARYVGACDVNGETLKEVCNRINQQYAKEADKAKYQACTAYGDFREMLARDDMDAVVIATPDHWHALLSIYAARAGKDIYCEKPLTLTISEARTVVKTVRRYGRVFQTGSQQRSNVFGKFRDACERVRNGRIGKVVSITDYGVFVELEEGVEGLIHVSEMTWSKKPRHPSKMVAVGDEIEVMVLNIEPETKRISLGMKQLQANPWDLVTESYPVGSIIEGKIKNITDFGVFIGIEDGIDGLIHVSDLSWTERIKHPSEKYAKGEMIQAVVLKIDKENERFSLGVKQLTPDPWQAAYNNYPSGTVVEGEITNVTDFGVFVKLEEGIEGLVHVSEISKDKVKTPVGMYQVGDILKAIVINVSAKDRKIGLSVKTLEDEGEAEAVEKIKKAEAEVAEAAPSTFGDLLKAAAEGGTPTEE